jgi:hypothetical protein
MVDPTRVAAAIFFRQCLYMIVDNPEQYRRELNKFHLCTQEYVEEHSKCNEPEILSEEFDAFIRYNSRDRAKYVLHQIVNGKCFLSKVARVHHLYIPDVIYNKMYPQTPVMEKFLRQLAQLTSQTADEREMIMGGIPPEILSVISKYCDMSSVLSLRQTCITMNVRLHQLDTFWKMLPKKAYFHDDGYDVRPIYDKLKLVGECQLYDDARKFVDDSTPYHDRDFREASMVLFGSGITTALGGASTAGVMALLVAMGGGIAAIVLGCLMAPILVLPAGVAIGSLIAATRSLGIWRAFKVTLSHNVIKHRLLERAKSH